VRRKAGTFTKIEQSILIALADLTGAQPPGAHGFLIASRLSAEGRAKRLAAHGTLYRALDRLERWGQVVSRWEDPDVAVAANRPRRRLYQLTAAGVATVERAAAERPGTPASVVAGRSRA